MTPSQIRLQIRKQRAALDAVTVQTHSALICRRLIQFLQMTRRPLTIALFLAQGNEIDLRSFAQWAWRQGHQLCVPIIGGRYGRMHFARYMPGSRLRANRYGIDEPCEKRPHVQYAQIDVVLVPLVACDSKGNRLGMGGGYYDRFFYRRHLRQYYRRPLYVGICHALQTVTSLPAQPWDLQLDAAVTENGITTFNNTPADA